MSYLGHSLEGFYPFIEMQPVYSTGPPDGARAEFCLDQQEMMIKDNEQEQR